MAAVMKQTILVVDDMQDMLQLLKRVIMRELDVSVETASCGADALKIVRSSGVSLVLADLKMPAMDGLELLKELKAIDAAVPVIMMTAYGSIQNAVEALKLGAYDYITKPFDEERLLHTTRRAIEHYALLRKNIALERRVRENESVGEFVGEAAPLKRLMETIRIVAKTDVTVLITGETGTGKDRAARLIHSLSSRVGRAFVAVNCPAIPENILESELFGYKRGAFTGAVNDKDGMFQASEGGTIFLDEIGDLSSALQAKLLRVLQEGEVKPLGENRAYRVNVRVIAATNQNLKEKIAAGRFREDLYYRLNVVSIHTPPLRDMAEDIPLLANHFLSRYCAELDVPAKKLSEDALRMLASRRWPGNVRELQNEIRRAVIFSKGDSIFPDDFGCTGAALPAPEGLFDGEALPYREARAGALRNFNDGYIRRLLQDTEGNVTLAAKRAGLERQSLQHLMRKYGICAGEFRSGANKP